MISENYFLQNKDIQFHFKNAVDWETIVDSYEQDFQDHKNYEKTKNENLSYAPSDMEEALEAYKSFLDSTGDIAGKYVAPQAANMDREGLKYDDGNVIFPEAMKECYTKAEEAGITSFGFSRRYGGFGLPMVVRSIYLELIARADSSFALLIGTKNIAEVLEHCASEELVQEWVTQTVNGNFWGAMALTEPDYGSDLPNITTRAVKDPNGDWTITGTKRFITHACGFDNTPAVIITLARTGVPNSGARGLSLFIVNSKDVRIASIEKKLGIVCSPTCEVVYENSPAILIGKEGYGLVKYSMTMMNGARLGIAAQATGVAQAAFSEAKKYASERKQFGKLIQDIPPVKKLLRKMERETMAMRCILYEAARCVDMYMWPKYHNEKEGKALSEVKQAKDIRKWEKLSNFYTPLSKYYSSEMSTVLADNAILVFGGAGYTTDYDVARIYRDARITPIYEGTTHLQVVAAISGISSGMKPESGFLKKYLEEEMKGFSISQRLKNLYTNFCEVSDTYRSLEDSNIREELAFEAVESSARFIASMLLERSVSQSSQEKEKIERKEHTEMFHIDSKAIISANLIRIQECSKKLL